MDEEFDNSEKQELTRIEQDIETLRKFARKHRNNPQVVRTINKLIYVLIVQIHRIKFDYQEESLA